MSDTIDVHSGTEALAAREHWWAEGWIGPHVPPWIARTWPG